MNIHRLIARLSTCRVLLVNHNALPRLSNHRSTGSYSTMTLAHFNSTLNRLRTNTHLRTPIFSLVTSRSFSVTSVCHKDSDLPEELKEAFYSKSNVHGPETLDQLCVVSDEIDRVLSSTDLGLSSYFPPSYVYDALTYIHDQFELPWCASIAMLTIVARLCMFPVMVEVRRKSALLANVAPLVQKHEKLFHDAINNNDYVKAMKHHQDMMENTVKMRKYLPSMTFLPLVNAVVFSSFFFALRAITNLPVPSIRDETLLWMESLSQTDPIFVLPAATALTLFYIFKRGGEHSTNELNSKLMKWAPIVLCPITFAFSCTFPAALVLYWFVNNQISLLQTHILARPSVQRFLDIPEIKIHSIEPSKKLNFQEGLKTSWENAKLAQNLEERKQVIEAKSNRK